MTANGSGVPVAGPRLEEVFKTSGVPAYTFVQPREYSALLLSLRTPGRGLVIEGPSGIGKTTAVENALKQLRLENSISKLSARRKEDVEYIEALPAIKSAGVVIVDDFHKLPDHTRSTLADYMKTLADEENSTTKLVVVGINKAGENLISFASDLVNRIDVIPFESNPEGKVRELVELGEKALNVSINVKDDIVSAAQGSFYIAQMLAREVCLRANVLEASDIRQETGVSFESVKADVWDRLARSFKERCERFCRGTRMRREGRAPYLNILLWMAQGNEWTLSLRDAIRSHPDLRGSVTQVVEKGYMENLIRDDPEITAVMHYDSLAQQLTIEDPQFVFFIRNLPWKQFAKDLGYLSAEFKNRYDFALSFAGTDRDVAEAIFSGLQEHEVEVFYDRNEQHRILAEDVEEYLRPIYQTEARFVICLLGREYPNRVWAKIESDAFRARFTEDAVIPIWFKDVPPGMFDASKKVGGWTIDRDEPLMPQIDVIVNLAIRKLAESR